MKAELKAKWIEALRSGEYKQGDGALKTSDGFCCLGVLCEVSGLDITEAKDGKLNTVNGYGYSYFDRFIDHADRAQLIHMNDTGSPFVAISDWIEANIPSDAEPRTASATAVVSSSENG